MSLVVDSLYAVILSVKSYDINVNFQSDVRQQLLIQMTEQETQFQSLRSDQILQSMKNVINDDIQTTELRNKTRLNYQSAAKQVVKKLQNQDLKQFDYKTIDFLCQQKRNVGIETYDNENEHVIEGDQSGFYKRTVLPKDRMLTRLRGYLCEEDYTKLHKLKNVLYGHFNIDKLTVQSNLATNSKLNLEIIKQKMEGLSNYQN